MKVLTLKDGSDVMVFFDGDDVPADDEADFDFTVHIGAEPFCEHCMELEPYSLEFSAGTTWCEDCADSIDGERIHTLLEDEAAMKQLKRWEREEQTKHLNARLQGLRDDDGDEDWDEDSDSDNDRFSDIEVRLDTLENDLADLGERLKKIEDFLREQEMARRQDVITLGVVEEPRWVGPDPEDDPKMVQTGPDTWRTKE